MADRGGSGATVTYRPLRARARSAVVFLAIATAADALAIWSGLRQRSLLADIAAGRPVADAEADSNDLRESVIALASLAAFTAAAAAFLTWFYRAYRNTPALGRHARWRSGWAIGAWFVPFLNLWRPKQIADDIWRGSEPGSPLGIVPAWVGLWWAAWISAQLVDNFSVRQSLSAVKASELRFATEVSVVASIAGILAGVGAIAFVVAVSRRQATLAGERGLAPTPPDGDDYRPAFWAAIAGIVAAGLIQAVALAAVTSTDTLGVGTAGLRPDESELPIADDFASLGVWPVESGAGYTMGYANGVYRIQVSRPGRQQYASVELRRAVPGLRLAIDAVMQTGAGRDRYGLNCFTASGAGYEGWVSARGDYAITRVDETGLPTPLVEGRNRRRIVQGTLSGTSLRLECPSRAAGRVRLWVNGKWLGAARDRRPLGPYKGIAFFTGSVSGDTEVRFDNFVADG